MIAWRMLSGALVWSLLALTCEKGPAENDVPDTDVDDKLQIVTHPSNLPPSAGLVTFTVTNVSERTLSVTMRDRFALNDEHLYVAQGSSASVQKNLNDAWTAVELPIMVEGVGEINLYPKRTYQASWYNLRKDPGLFRLLLRYEFNDGQSGISFSNTFEIRSE